MVGDVAVATGNDLTVLTEKAIGLCGGIGAFIASGDKVFIKPNYVQSDTPPFEGVTVKPEIVKKVARLCMKEGAEKVTIGEYAHTTPVNFDLQGVRDLEKEGVELWDLKDHDCCCTIESKTEGLRKIYVNKYLLEADKLISIAVLKTHSGCCNTLCAKNLIGTTPLWAYAVGTGWGVRRVLHHVGMDMVIVDLAEGLKPCLNIVDASIGTEGQGPVKPSAETRDVKDSLGHWVVLAGSDTFKVDIIGSAMMYQNPRKILYYVFAKERGLISNLNPFRLELVGDVTDLWKIIMRDWKPPSIYPQYNREAIIPEEPSSAGIAEM